MSDLISRQAAIERLKKHRKVFCKNHMEFTILSDEDKARVDEIDNAIATLVNLPSAQPEIIYCKDCKWKQGAECVRFADVRPFPSDFCSRAERREE